MQEAHLPSTINRGLQSAVIELYTSHKLNPVALVRERTLPIEGPPLVGEVNANFYG
jgi:hypothetical protein